MIENNAGETPYMVAHRYQQWDAERLLLNVEQQHGEILCGLLYSFYLLIQQLAVDVCVPRHLLFTVSAKHEDCRLLWNITSASQWVEAGWKWTKSNCIVISCMVWNSIKSSYLNGGDLIEGLKEDSIHLLSFCTKNVGMGMGT